jgi:hypothetical protein
MRTAPEYQRIERAQAGWMKARLAFEAYRAERKRERGEVKPVQKRED